MNRGLQPWLVHALWRARRAGRDMVLRRGARDPKTIREDVTLRYLKGDGIEIGALDYPLRLPRGARVRYVDYLDGPGLREAYSNTLREGRPLVAPDVVDDGARLASFADGSLDFVVANHMLEHVEDPIAALEHQLRVLRPSGILYLTLPDARHSFDSPRQRTTVEHLLRDHRDGPEVSRSEHYEECARLIEGHNGENLTKRAREMKTEGLRPHFHVWEPNTFAGFLAALDLPFSLELLQVSAGEFLVVLLKEANRRGEYRIRQDQALRIVPKRSSKTSPSSTATACAKRLAVTVQRSRKPTLPSNTKL